MSNNNDLSMEDISKCISQLKSNELIDLQPYVMLVPSYMADDADKLFNSVFVKTIGNYSLYNLRGKTYWARINGLKDRYNKKYTKDDFVRKYYGEYCDEPEKASLPRAMRKRGYYVKYEYWGFGEYRYWVERKK